MPDYDVIVVGAGNAALAASVSARNSGAERVLVLEKARQEMRGGNTHYSGGLLRIAFDKTEDILRLMPRASEIPGYAEGVEPYPRDAFWEDLRRMTSNRTDPELAEILISNSYDTASWMAEQDSAACAVSKSCRRFLPKNSPRAFCDSVTPSL